MRSFVSRGSRSKTRRGEPGLRRSARPRRTQGFTLVEIIVVLAIVALISGTLLAAFQRVLDVRLRLAAFLDGTDTPNLVASWFRESVDGLVPDVQGGADKFAGDARHFAGLTLAPLSGMSGVPTRVVWQLDFNADSGRTSLRYQAAADPGMTIASWPDNRGKLQYCTANLTCYDTWPPPKQRVSQVPTLIRLDIVKGTEPWAILAAPQSDRDSTQNPTSGGQSK
jgi:prepilin-type N-terminal cleavage/methylation domain-containing protein